MITMIQRVEGGAIAVAALVAAIVLQPAWWWVPLAAFLLFDLSMVGYLRSPALGAAVYNSVHTYVWPALATVVAIATASSSPAVSGAATLVAASWALHVGVDRAIGAGLKHPDSFGHTHLGSPPGPASVRTAV
jgi:hypothetical protein